MLTSRQFSLFCWIGKDRDRGSSHQGASMQMQATAVGLRERAKCSHVPDFYLVMKHLLVRWTHRSLLPKAASKSGLKVAIPAPCRWQPSLWRASGPPRSTKRCTSS